MTTFDQLAQDRDHLKRIHQLFCAMPFGGLCNFDRPTAPVGMSGHDVLTLEQVANNLSKLREVLDHQVTEQNAEREELGKYRRLTSALREVAGLFRGVDDV